MMTPINSSPEPISKRKIDNEIDGDHHRGVAVADGGRVQPLQILTLMMLMLTVASLAKAIEDDDSTTRAEEQPGRPRFFRFSHHRQRSSSVQPNEFYQLSMNASLEACGEEDNGSEVGVTKRSGIDGSCQHKIVARISIETAAASGHHSWDNDDMHLHFLLDEVYLPDEAEYGKPKDTFAINVTLEVPYVRHRLEKVQVLNCYVTGHDPTEKVHSTRPTTTMEWNTDEMVSPSMEPQQVETKEHQNYNDGDEEEPDDWEWEHQKNLGKVYEGGKRGGFRFQGNDEAGVYDHSYGFDVDGDDPLSKESHQGFSDHHQYRYQQVESQRAKHGRNFQLTTKRASSIHHTTNRRHQSPEYGNRIYFHDDDDSQTAANRAANEDDYAYDQYNNYYHLEGNGPSRTERSGGSSAHQLKKFGVYMVRSDDNASHVEYSSVVSIRYWQDPAATPSASQAEDVVNYTRLTSSSNIYVNQISSIRFQAGAVGADADGPDAATVSTRKSREPRRRQPGGNGGGVDKKNRHPKETDSRKNNHRFISPGSDDCLTKSRGMNWSNPNELMLIDPSGMGRGGDWGAPSVKRRSSSGGGNWAEKLLWVGGAAGDGLAGNDGGDDDAGNRLKRKSFRNEETTPDGGRLFCPGLGPWRETVKVESLKAHFGGTRTRLKHCDDGLCLEVPVAAAAMAFAFKYEIQLAYSADLVAPLDQNHQNQQQQPDGQRIKITNIITTFHGPMVNDDGESSSKKRTPTATHKKGNNIMLLEVALVYLGHSPQHQQQRRHHSELVQVNIDARCLSYLSSIGTTTGGGDDEAAAAADANQQQAPKMVRLKPEELQTVLFRFPIDGDAVAVRNEEFECGVTVTQAGTDLSGPSKSATRSRRYSDSNSSNDSSESSPAPLSSHSTAAVVLAERKFLIKPGARCVCSDFACRCTCLLGMVSPAEPKSTPLGTGAGPSGTPGSGPGPGVASDGSCQMIITFGAGGEDRNHQHHPQARGGGFWHWFWVMLLLAMFVLILLGCVKAVLGCCWIRIGKWKYDFLQPVVRYKDASSYRRFLINTIFFLVYPCVLCCRCFERSIDGDGDDDVFQSGGDDERDRLLQQHGLLKGVMVVQKPVPLSTTSVTSADEEDVLGDGWHTANGGEGLGKRSWKKNPEDVATTDDDELSKLVAAMQSESEGGERPVMGAKHETKPYNNTEDEDNDTRFVMDVMNQSRKSLRTLVR
ncbi:uncharacterized protein LOC115259828 isoform X4 [Aedes albopictus]|uniref:Generative cell specific-1/HAP2 domain-containing protein n=1 Tax=Aedes albopictus TaxID=7160 RepID=A0ABM1YQR4_AEDAL